MVQNMKNNKLKRVLLTIGISIVLIFVTMLLVGFTDTIEPTTLYAKDGRTMIVNTQTQLDAQQTVGWSIYEPVTMYNANGETSIVFVEEIEYCKTLGWELEPFVTLYAADGRTEKIIQSKVEEQLTVGWYRTYEEAHPARLVYDAFIKSNLSIQQLNNILSNTAIAGYGESFYWLEQNYNINAIFAISIAVVESGAGTSYNARKRNNLFGIGPHKVFNSKQECINYLGMLLNKKLYKGKSINAIGKIYCTDGTDWAGKVKNQMGVLWNRK